MPIRTGQIPDEQRAEVDRLWDLFDAATDMEDGPARDQSLDDVIRLAAQVEYPQLMMLAFQYKMRGTLDNGNFISAPQIYLQAMGVMQKYADYIDPDIRESVLSECFRVVVSFTVTPQVPRPTIEAILDQIEQQTRREGFRLLDVAFCRAEWAAHIGDRDALEHWTRIWQAEDSHLWDAKSRYHPSVDHWIDLEPARALDILDRGYAAYRDREDEFDYFIEGTRAYLLARLGNTEAAADLMNKVLEEGSPVRLIESDTPAKVLRGLEADRETAQELAEIVESALPDLRQYPHRYSVWAALARHYLLDPATASKAAPHRAFAEKVANTYDVRNGNTHVSRSLHQNWFADLR